MSGINLLPWREWQRQRAVRQLQWALLATVVTGAVVLLAMAVVLDRRLDAHLRENAAASERISGLDGALADIALLVVRRDDLLGQQAELLDLQRQPGADLLARLMRLVPENVRLDGLQLSRDELRLSGFARSGSDVAQLLRNLGQAPGASAPELQDITSTRAGERFQVLLGFRASS